MAVCRTPAPPGRARSGAERACRSASNVSPFCTMSWAICRNCSTSARVRSLAVTTTTGRNWKRGVDRIRFRNVMPSITGMIRSSRTRSGRNSSIISSASRPLAAVRTSHGSCLQQSGQHAPGVVLIVNDQNPRVGAGAGSGGGPPAGPRGRRASAAHPPRQESGRGSRPRRCSPPPPGCRASAGSRLDRADDLPAVQLRHHQVHGDQLGPELARHAQALLARTRRDGLAAELLDRVRQQRARVQLVINHQHQLAGQSRLSTRRPAPVPRPVPARALGGLRAARWAPGEH